MKVTIFSQSRTNRDLTRATFHDSSWLRAAFTDTAVSGQRSSQEMVLQCWTHPRVPKELRKHDRAGLGKSQTYGRMKPKKSGKINEKRRLANNYHGTLGGNYITRGLQELKRFFEVKVLLNQLSYEETVHMFSFKKWNDVKTQIKSLSINCGLR